MAATPQVECTYRGCFLTFSTEKEMKKHKHEDEDHEFYCKRCNYDGKDWDDLLRHKVITMIPFVYGDKKHLKVKHMMHIVCEFCGEDYKSLGGRDHHRKQMHPADQQIRCPGSGETLQRDTGMYVKVKCQETFDRPSAMMKHIESGMCNFIGPRDVERERTAKKIVKQILEKPEVFMEALCNKAQGPDLLTGGAEEDGGVPLMMHNAANLMDLHVPITRLTHEQWPRSGLSSNPAIEAARLRSADEDNKASLIHCRFWDPSSPDYCPDRFYDAEAAAYRCPFPDCDADYLAPIDIETHLTYAHATSVPVCPRCCKRFESTTGLLQHLEASQRGSRCLVSKQDNFEMIVHELTGGFVAAQKVSQERIAGYTVQAGVVAMPGPAGPMVGVMATRYTAHDPRDANKGSVW